MDTPAAAVRKHCILATKCSTAPNARVSSVEAAWKMALLILTNASRMTRNFKDAKVNDKSEKEKR